MNRVYLGAATRTPIGKFGGSLKKLTASDLATAALSEALRRAPEAPDADLVFLGHARQAGGGPNTARQATVRASLGESVPAITLNQACASGMTAVIHAADKIQLGRARSVWAGGVESMTHTPYLLPKARWGFRLGHQEILDGMHKDGFFCPMAQMLMGETVEVYLARELGITRVEQDEFALRSQKQADRAWKEGFYRDETFLLEDLAEDEHRRSDATLESLAKLPPVFDSAAGTLTAGNSSGITDGAAFLHVSDQKLPHAQAEFVDYEIVALDPRRMGLGPVSATQRLLARQGLKIEELEAVEINEAFAAQVIACQRELRIPLEKLNAWGGAIAIGHPIGASGARILVTLLSRLRGKPGALGLATLCVSGGQGVAVLVRSIR